MANKTFEDLAKNLGYNSFFDMKTAIGKSNRSALSDIFAKRDKKKTSPSREGAGGDTINSDIIPFLNIIAKNSLALPGMARDMNVLRQNIVKLVKLKNAEAITKADKFFKSEDQREAELEDARKKETTPVAVNKEGKPKKEKTEKEDTQGVAGYLWDLLKKILATLFLGIGLGFASVFNIGKLVDTIKEKLNPLPLIEKFFDSIAEGWKEITETDIIKETLIKGVGKFLDFITAGLFGEKELRKSLGDLKEFVTPMIDVITETFKNIVAWLQDNIGWDPFTIPLSKINDLPGVSAVLKRFGFGFSDIQIPGFRPFKDKKEAPAPTGSMTPAAPPTTPQEDTSKAKTSQGDIVYDDMGNVVSGSAPTGTTPSKEPAKKSGGTKTQRVSSPETLAKEAEKDKKGAVEFLKNQVGVIYDPNSPTKFADLKTGKPIEEVSVRDRIKDMRGNPDKILSLLKPSATAAPATTAPASPPGSTGGATAPASPPGSTGGATESATGGSMGGASLATSPSAETKPAPATSGAALSTASSDVAEGQRMDAAADAGVVVDAGTTNNNVSSAGKKPKQVADVYNTSFVNNYYGKTAAA
jgi:hypothetical protein